MTQYEAYISAVSSGRQIACKYVQQAVSRHLSDLKRKDWAFYFDPDEADRAIMFCRLCRHTSGKLGGHPFNLQDNQAFILAMLFGWRRKEDNSRRFTQCYLEMARKAGKSELAAVIELYTGFCEGEEGAQVYTAATTRDQANMVFRAVKKMAASLKRDVKAMKKHIDVLANSVVFKLTDSFIQKVSADAGTLDGLNPHCAVIDEYHAHKNDLVKGVMQTGMGSRHNPLLLVITTAGFDKSAPCFAVERKNAVEVLAGDKTQDNLFALIFTLDEGDDWQDESVWIKSNPNLGSTPTLQYLRDQVQDAKNKGSSTQVQVLTKNFNLWTDAPEIWIPEDQIKAVCRPIDLSEFAGRKNYIGLDVGAVRDMTAIAIYSPGDENGPALLKVFFYVPEEQIEVRKNEVPYDQWARGGHLTTTPGNTFDFDYALRRVHEINEACGARQVSFDRWNAYQIATALSESGVEVMECRPSYANLNQPVKSLENAIVSGEIAIDYNPVLLWNFRNVVFDRNADDSVKPNKKKSGEKIDGIAATLCAMFAAFTDEGGPKSYLLDPDAELVIL